jgi:integral membrane protein
MKEIVFIRNNIAQWQEAEQMADHISRHSPDELADAYMRLTADLAFAQTHYPHSRITAYLNNLASTLHNEIYGNKREKWSRVVTFWTHEVPLVMYDERRLLFVSLVIMLTSALVGIVSQTADPEFVRVILGDAYVDMTLDNIARGVPMDVYADGRETDMFLSITFNNVYVAFRTFALGLLTVLGTGWSLFYNGIMLGCFETFFVQKGLFVESFLAVFLHGTLEITAIVVAGAAGLALGSGWMFPGTYSRGQSFRRGARRGLKIVVGTVPVFVMAGFIEGFITRHTEWSDGLRLGVIVLSLAFVVYYYVLLPRYRKNRSLFKKQDYAKNQD